MITRRRFLTIVAGAGAVAAGCSAVASHAAPGPKLVDEVWVFGVDGNGLKSDYLIACIKAGRISPDDARRIRNDPIDPLWRALPAMVANGRVVG
jgi:hypothetical protein